MVKALQLNADSSFKAACETKGHELYRYKHFIKNIIIVLKFSNCEISDHKIHFKLLRKMNFK